jgi:hypothetical protein
MSRWVYLVMVKSDDGDDWFVFATRKDADAYALDVNRRAADDDDDDTRATVYREAVR